MSTAIVYENGSDEIMKVVRDAHLVKGTLRGVNNTIGAKGLLTGKLRIKWVSDDSVFTEIPATEFLPIRYVEKVSDYPAVEDGPSIKTVINRDVLIALKKREDMANLSFDQVDNFIDNLDLSDPIAVKSLLKKIAKAILGQILISDYYRQ